MKNNILMIIIGILIVMFMIVVPLGVYDGEDYKFTSSSLPNGSTNITYLDNGWITFELNGLSFLYHKDINAGQGFECITQIQKERKGK